MSPNQAAWVGKEAEVKPQQTDPARELRERERKRQKDIERGREGLRAGSRASPDQEKLARLPPAAGSASVLVPLGCLFHRSIPNSSESYPAPEAPSAS